jgi:hypothetical protein
MFSCIFVSHPLFGDDDNQQAAQKNVGEIDHLMGTFENVCFFHV